jgi:hypothetical protein
MLRHSDTLSPSLYFYYLIPHGEAANAYFIVFSFTDR